MMSDFPLGETLDFKFTTRAFATGIPTVLTGSPAVEVYEDNSTAQITAGETLSANFDSIVGLNNLRIVASSGNGYEEGKNYAAILSAGTVGGVSVVGEVVAQFSIGRSGAFDRLGAPAGASISADIADVPTVSQFNARTLVAASYFDPASDAVATVTNLSNLPSIPANWLTAAGINANALNGKGDWNIGKSGYALTTADWNVGKTGYSVNALAANTIDAASIAANAMDGKGNWNIGKTGYSLTQTFPTNFADMAITLTTGRVTVGTMVANVIDAASIAASALDGKGNWNLGKTGYSLSVADWNVGKSGYSLSVTPPTLAQIIDGVLNEDMTAHQTDGTLGGAIGDPGASGESIWDAVVSGAAGTNVAADIIAIKAVVDGLNDISSANVLTQVNAALDTAISEIAQGIPSATPTLRTAVMLLYMALRNRLDVSTSGTDELQIRNNAGTVICKKLLTDAAGDYSEAEMVSGP